MVIIFTTSCYLQRKKTPQEPDTIPEIYQQKKIEYLKQNYVLK